MRVVITGASGNVGTALVRRLGDEKEVDALVGLCRRAPSWRPPKTTWVSADVATDDLADVFRGADAVVHLAWLFQPTHSPEVTWQANAVGSVRVLEAVARAHVPTVVYASSVGAYSPRKDLDPVDESWPTHGWSEAAYSREKAYVERVLDHHEAAHPDRRVVRMRPAFIFTKPSAVEQRRLFLGPFFPQRLARPGRVPVIPDPGGLRLQALHTEDAADAYARAVLQPVSGAFNLAAEPVLDMPAIAACLGARTVKVPASVARAGLAAGWHAHLLPASPHLFDLVARIPMLETTRARQELGWTPRHDALDAVRAFLEGLRSGEGGPTPPLAPDTGGRHRGHEVATGVGVRP
ncbi:MAG: NAD-dependent epimerase/dehydratase family protein [Actinomycetota bacterium]|nr:NAD-dependent epimerase/dehydratase family protein [Actinomycetota bacterium]